MALRHVGRPFGIAALLFMTLLAMTTPSNAAPFTLYADDFSSDLAVWNVEGAWQLEQGAL